MTGYSAFHLALGGFCVLTAAVHFAVWRIVRTEPSLVWIAVSFLGFAALDFSLAGCSVGAGGLLGPRTPWLLLSAASSLLCVAGVYRTAWSLLEAEMNPARRYIERATFIVAAAGQLVGMARLYPRPGFEVPTWEELMFRPGHFQAQAEWLVILALEIVWIVEAVLALRRRRKAAAPILLGGVISFGTTLYGMAPLLTDAPLRPTWFGATAAIFILFASVVTVSMTVETARFAADRAMASYRILRRLASGGMGELYLAARVGPGGFQRLVALKKMKNAGQADRDRVERFLAEARLTARLSHPNIVAVHDIGRLDDGWFIAMEYVAGVSLSQLVRRAAQRGLHLPAELAVPIVEEACGALAHAHALGIIHRDLKPHNVMLSFDGSPKIIDFGIAKESSVPEEPFGGVPVVPASPDTQAGVVAGTISYMAPERLRGEPASVQSDIYAMGAVLYELLVGRPMCRPDAEGKLIPLREARPGVPESIVAAVERATALEPGARFASAAAMAGALRAIREALPACDRSSWIRRLFADDWAADQRLTAGMELLPPSPPEPATEQVDLSPTVRARVGLPRQPRD